MTARPALQTALILALTSFALAPSAAAAANDGPPLLLAEASPLRAQRPIMARPVSLEPDPSPPAAQPAAPVGAPTPESAAADEPPPLIAAPLREVLEPEGGLEPSISAPAVARPARPHPGGLLFGFNGVQQPLRADLVVRPIRGLSATVGVGGLPASLGQALLAAASVQGGSLSSWSAEVGLLIFPLGGSFFLGASAGHNSLLASAATKAGTVSFDISSFYLTPHLGWLATWDSGFSAGFDLGAQLPISPSVTTSGPRQAAATVDALARTLAALPLPTVALKLGWML